jgi:hypothetical protein
MRAVLAAGATVLVLATSDCGSGPATSERRATPAPAPDPSAMEVCKHNPGCALLQLSWDRERSFTIRYQAGAQDIMHSVRWAPYRDDNGNWKGLFQLPVTVKHNDVVKLSGSPIGPDNGLVITAVYHLGVDLCANVPGSHRLAGSAGCTVTIP